LERNLCILMFLKLSKKSGSSEIIFLVNFMAKMYVLSENVCCIFTEITLKKVVSETLVFLLEVESKQQ